MAREGRRPHQGRRHDRRDLDRQGRSGAAGARKRHGQRDPGRRGRHGDGRPGDRAHRRERAAAPAANAGSGRRRRPARAREHADGTTRPTPDGTPRSPRWRRARRRSRAWTSPAVSGSGPAGRITKADVLSAAAAGNGAATRAAPPPTAAATAAEPSSQPLKGGAAALARYMEESRSIPTATSFRTLTVTRARRAPARAEGGRAQGVVHAPDRLRDRARGARTCR